MRFPNIKITGDKEIASNSTFLSIFSISDHNCLSLEQDHMYVCIHICMYVGACQFLVYSGGRVDMNQFYCGSFGCKVYSMDKYVIAESKPGADTNSL